MSEKPWRGPNERRSRAGVYAPEFPVDATTPPVEISRRDLLTLLGASAALAGAQGCGRGPAQSIVPYVRTPPDVTPSVASKYATTMTLDGYGTGMVLESHEGRPTKAEGNPAHPASGGGLGPMEQACILGLYDPTRAQAVTHAGAPATWDEFVRAVTQPPPPGQRIHVLLEPTSAPHLVDLVERARVTRNVVVHYDAPLAPAAAWAGASQVFGRVLEPHPDFRRADVVLALDADFLAAASAPIAWARAWADRRRLATSSDAMSRLYVVEPRLSVTGMSADERLRVQAREVQAVAAGVLARVAAGGVRVPEDIRRAAKGRPEGPYDAWMDAVSRDLQAHAGASVVIAGRGQPPAVHALAHAINEALGNAGPVVSYVPSPIHEAGEGSHGLAALVRAIDAGEVSTLILMGGNPAYSAAVDHDLTRRLAKVRTTAFLGPRDNETARACAWFVPEAHFLEAWGDARAFQGTASIVQPLIEAMYAGKTSGQVLAALLGSPDATSLDLVQSYWRAHTESDFATFWRRALVRGVIDSDPTAPQAPAFDWSPIAAALKAEARPPAPLEIVYFADAKVHDGRFGDNAWLQELADPVTKLTWDNAALMSPGTAAHMQLANEEVVAIEVRGRALRLPVLVVPGMADDVVAVAVGYGQAGTQRVSSGVGANAYTVRDSLDPWFDDATLRKTGASLPLALTQEHWSMEGRPIVLHRTMAEYRSDPKFAAARNEVPTTLYEFKPAAPSPLENVEPSSLQWGMTIDLNACTGCSACVVACMAENNIPVVGKSGVRLSREMHWLRIDRYFVGDGANPAVVVQPMLCQHCEKAPCEYVCPVNATVHSPDGLNEMIYNRCVGTRFCSNNCPYKVRRFNFFNYNAGKDDTLKLSMNPDVTVRARGVMEKCTYCVQRIREVEIRARREQRPILDLEVVTACQDTCPTGAIVFGNIADKTTRVSQTRGSERLYQVLSDLGTLPRTRYLARVVNPNPELHPT